MQTPTMRLAKARAIATTYEFVVDKPLGGYALCTVNDGTGELLITSDWGNWAHQWSPDPRALGAPNLTAFLARNRDVDYIAKKLQGRRGGERFSASATAKALIRIIAKKRLEDGRHAIENAREDEITVEQAERDLDLRQRGDDRFLTASSARSIADSIEAVAADIGDHCTSAEALFVDRLCAALQSHDAYELIPEPWELAEYEQTYDDKVLRGSILPALFEACGQSVFRQMVTAANGPQPPLEVGSC